MNELGKVCQPVFTALGKHGPGVLLCLLSLGAARASNPILTTSGTDLSGPGTAAPVEFAQIPVSSTELRIAVESVKLKIRHVAAGQEIELASNCPAHWNVTGRTITQVGFSTAQKGVSLRADAAGAQVSVNGRIYRLPTGSDGSIHSLKVENGSVIINGQKLDPMPGSDKPGSCTGPDVLEISVPQAYSGGLTLVSNGASDINVDGWQGGAVKLKLNGASSLSAGKFSQLTVADLDIAGSGKAEIKDVSARSLVANITGSGTVLINGGHAEMSNATISGTGTIILHGRFNNMKQAVQGTGSIKVLE